MIYIHKDIIYTQPYYQFIKKILDKKKISNEIIDAHDLDFVNSLDVKDDDVLIARFAHDEEDKIKTHIWDTAGQEYFSAIISTYYRGIAGAVIVFDVTNRESFKKVSFWLNEIKKRGTPNFTPVLILVGNKIDDDSRVVFKHEGEEFATTHNMMYCETSAKKGINVEKFYRALIEKIHDTANLIDPDEKKGIR